MIRRLGAIALVGLAGACHAPSPAPTVVHVRVVDDAKTPVENVEILSGGKAIARTGGDGRAELHLSGPEGAAYDVDVRCPPTHRSPGVPIRVQRVSGSGPTPEYLARCQKLRHMLVVAIRADGGDGLPVLHLGKEVTRTDAFGSAHVLVEGELHERIELQLDTRDPTKAKLHPQNPVAVFEVSDQDDVKTFDVKFTRDRPPPARVFHRSAPKAF